MLLFFSVAVRMVLQMRMTHIVEDQELIGITALTTRHTFIWLFIGAVFLAIMGYPIIQLLYGQTFSGAYPILLWVLPGTIAYGVMQIQMSYFIAERRLFFVSVVAIFAVTVNLGILFIYGEHLNGIIAGFAQSLSSIIWLIIYIIGFFRVTRTPMRTIFPGKREIEFYLSNWLTLSQKFRSIITKS